MFEATVPVVEVGVRVREAATTLADDSRACASWTAEERAAALDCVRAAEAALAQARAHLLVAVRDSGELERPGDRSFEAALGRSTRTGAYEATRQVRQADTLVSMPSVAAGVRNGLVPLGHLDALARVTATAAPEVAAALRAPETQDRVVLLAQTLSAPDFAKSLAQLVAAKDPAAVEVAFEAQRRERFLTISVQPHGAYLKGRLDTISAESLRIALDLMGQHPDDTRTPAQASADALVMLAHHACAGTGAVPGTHTGPGPSVEGAAGTITAGVVSSGRSAPIGDGDAGTALTEDPAGRTGRTAGSAPRPHLSLLVPAETFVELIRHQHALDTTQTLANDRDGGGGRGRGGGGRGGGGEGGEDQLALGLSAGPRAPSPGRVAPVITPPWSTVAPWQPVPPATLEDGTPVPMSELARALCDADLTRIVMSAEGQPLDVGRTKRLFTPAMRRAAVARDQQCIWNDCTAPASRCEMHHLRWWDAHHGTTSLVNAGLACGHHHHLIHQLHLTVQRLTPPPGSVAREEHAGRPIPPTTPSTNGQPVRYLFRDPTGRIVNAPEEGRASDG